MAQGHRVTSNASRDQWQENNQQIIFFFINSQYLYARQYSYKTYHIQYYAA